MKKWRKGEEKEREKKRKEGGMEERKERWKREREGGRKKREGEKEGGMKEVRLLLETKCLALTFPYA